MGKEHDKSADVEDKKKKPGEVDTDAEHNKETSRKASNADLKRTARSSASAKSYGTAQTALKFMSAEFHRWAKEVDELRHSDTSGEAGAEPAALGIEEIFEHAMDDVRHVGALLSAAPNASTLAPEVAMAQGAAFVLRTQLEPASQWLANHQHAILPLRNLTEGVEAYNEKLGAGYEQGMAQNRRAPEEDEDTLRKQVAVGEIDALEAAIASVEAGNQDDASRVRTHATTLRQFIKEHGIRISSAGTIKRLQKMNATLHKMADSDASLANAAGDIKALLLHHE